MSFFFGESKIDREVNDKMRRIQRDTDIIRLDTIDKLEEKDKKDKLNGEKNFVELCKKIKTKFPDIDIDFFVKLESGIMQSVYFEISIEKLNYNQFISYKLSSSYIFPFKLKAPSPYYEETIKHLNELDINIFMSNVSIDWKTLQLAKKDTSIQIQTTKPSPKTSPTSPKPSPKKSPTKPKSQSPSKPSPKKQSPKKPSGSHGYIHNVKRHSPKPSPKNSSTKPKSKSPSKPSPKKSPPKPKYQSPPKQKTYNWDNTDNPTRPPPEYKPSKSWF